MSTEFNNFGVHFRYGDYPLDSHGLHEQNIPTLPFHNDTASTPVAPAPPAQQYPSPRSSNTTIRSPYPTQSGSLSQQPSWAAIVQGRTQESRQAPPPTTAGLSTAMQYTMQGPLPVPLRSEFSAREAHHFQGMVRGRQRTYAEVVQEPGPTNAPLPDAHQQLVPLDTRPNFLSSASPGTLGHGPPISSAMDFLGSDVLYNANFQWGIGEQFDGIGNWAEQPRAAGDRTRPRRDTRLSNSGADGSLRPSITATSPSTTSRSSVRRKRNEMTTGNYDHRCDVCDFGFDTMAELNHHFRCHKNYEDRPHRCSVCGNRFLFAKDLRRHSQVHNPHAQKWFCPHASCKYATTGFKRDDHLQRHLQSQHPVDSVMQSSGPSSLHGH